MDNLSKSIIRFMSQQSNEKICFCSLSDEWNYESDVSIEQLSEAVHDSPDKIRLAVAYLVENNLAEYRILSSRIGPVKIAFRLKHAGIHFKEIQRLTSREKWKERAYGFCAALAIWGIEELIKWLIQQSA